MVSAALALWMTFLLGRQAIFGQDPPTRERSTTAVEWPAFAIAQASDLPDSPLPMIRISKCCWSGIAVPLQVESSVGGPRRESPRRGKLNGSQRTIPAHRSV